MDLMRFMPGTVVVIDDIPNDDLNFLSGKLGVITQVLNSPARKNMGYIVKIYDLPDEESEWFIETRYVKLKQS